MATCSKYIELAHFVLSKATGFLICCGMILSLIYSLRFPTVRKVLNILRELVLLTETPFGAVCNG